MTGVIRMRGVMLEANSNKSSLCRFTVVSSRRVRPVIFLSSARKKRGRKLSSEILNVAILISAGPISDKREGNTSCIAQSPLCMNGSIEPGHKAKGKLS